MKKYYFLLLALTILISTPYAKGKDKNKELQEFVNDLSSANIKLRGKLLLFGEFKDDLSRLTFEEYVKLLKQNESSSNRGLSAVISKADSHLFLAKENSFLIAIYSKKMNAVLYDDSSTSFTDSVMIINEKAIIPELSKFISKSKF